MELENTTPSATITDLLGAVNARCGGAHPVRLRQHRRHARHRRHPRAADLPHRHPLAGRLAARRPRPDPQPAAHGADLRRRRRGQPGLRPALHGDRQPLQVEGLPAATGGDADAGDGQGCFNATRTAQATRLLTWINSTVLPAAGDPDVLLLGDFNSYAQGRPGHDARGRRVHRPRDRRSSAPSAYSYLFDGQLGHLDYGFASASLLPQVTGVGTWHINADEVDLFDYNDEVFDSPGEASFEEKPDGSRSCRRASSSSRDAVPRLRPRPGARRARPDLAERGTDGQRKRAVQRGRGRLRPRQRDRQRLRQRRHAHLRLGSGQQRLVRDARPDRDVLGRRARRADQPHRSTSRSATAPTRTSTRRR